MRRYLLILFLWSLCLTGQPYSKEEFARRRDRVLEAIGPNAAAVLKGNEGMPGYVPFRQDNNFFYLTGVEAPGAMLLLDGGTKRAVLFLPRRNEARERSEGPLLAPDDAARTATGIALIEPVDAFTASVQRLAGIRQTIYTPMAPMELEAMSRDLALRYNLERLDDPWDGRSSREAHFVSLLRQRYPNVAVQDLTPVLDKLRLIKSAEEIAVLRRASTLAAEALAEGMRSTRAGQYEYELGALGKFIFYRNGAQGLAYYALVATGRNAYMPHYHTAQSQLKDGELFLMDFAPDYHYQMADVTRMWPVNGKFSPWQRELYGFYVACYQAIIKHIRPRVPVETIMNEAAAEMETILAAGKFSEEKYRRAAQQFVADYKRSAANGRLGHWVGMSTHDVGGSQYVLQPNMVFTIEPALRVPEDQIYIRLEDMLLVTQSGVENLSAKTPIAMEAIEALMKEQGLLKQYPRVP